MKPGIGSGESKLESAISYLLLCGVIGSLILEVIGLVLFYRAYGNLGISDDPAMFISGRDFFSFAFELFRGGGAPNSAVLFMTAGIVLLILTPYVRVVLSAFYFGAERNIKYLLITLFVLAVVTVSLALH